MTLSKSTRYALYAALEMGAAGDSPVTVGGTASRHGIPPGALAKVFQHLVRSGLAVGTRGIGGGYRLARAPSEVTVLDVVSVFERPRRDGECLLAECHGRRCPNRPACRIRSLFDEVDEVTRSTLASVTLETLVRPAPASRARRRTDRGSP